MKKKLIAGMTSTALIASIGAPAFAANFSDVNGHWAASTINKLADAGIINGLDAATFAPEGTLTRAQFAKLITVALKLDTSSTTSSFSDVSGWAVGYVEAAKTAGIINGTDATHFDPNGTLTREQAAAIMVRALRTVGELQPGTSLNFPDADQVSAWFKSDIEVAVTNGLLNGKDGKLAPQGSATRAEAAVLTDRFLTKSDEIKNQGLKVLSVSASNAIQLKVVFNKAVDKTSAEKPANYTLNSVAPSSAVLQADGKSVVLTLAAAVAANTDLAVTVQPIELAKDTTKTSPLYSTVVNVNDTTAPTVTSVTATTNGVNATTATVSFSEPLVSGNVIVDGGAPYVINGSVTPVSSLDLTGLSLDPTKGHTVEVINLKDTAGNVTSDATYSFSVTVDNAAPVVNVSAYNDNEILVTFSKKMPVDSSGNLTVNGDATKLLASNFTVKDEALASLGTVATVTAVPGDTTGTQFVVDFGAVASTFYSNSTTRNLQLVIKGTDTVGTITDALGNKLADTVKPVSLNKDTVAPTVTSVTVEKDANGNATSFTFHYSEPVSAPAGKVTIVDSNGVLQPQATAIAGTDAKSVVVPVTVLTGQISVSYDSAFVTDKALTPNNGAAYSTTVNLGTPASATGKYDVSNVAASGRVITVTFPTAVKGGNTADSATNVANYSYAGRALPVGTSITLNAVDLPAPSTPAQTIATITLPVGSIAATTTSAFNVNAGIAALNGSVSNVKAFTLTVNDNTAPVLQSAQMTAYDATAGTATFVLTYSEAIKTLGASNSVLDELVLKDNGTAVGTASTATNVSGYANKVTVTVSGLATAIGSTDALTFTTQAATAPADLVDNASNAETTAVTVTVAR